MSILDNPSLDTGAVADPFIPYGWTNSGLDAGDTEAEAVVRHSEGASLQFNTTAVAGEKITQQLALASGKYFSFGAWTYGDGSAGFKLNCVNAVLHGNPAVSTLNTPHTAAWTRTVAVWRATAANPTVEIEADDGAAAERYVDDLYLIALDDVTLTVTPASQANSLESPGLRVDGLDKAPQTISGIALSKGKIKFNVTPRHSAATVALIGNATPIVAYAYGNANNYILLDWSAANTLRLRYNASGGGVQTGTWDATGAIVAGTTYAMEIRYTSGAMYLLVNNVIRITVSAASVFNAALATFYPGSDATPANQFDAVYS